MSKGKKSAGRSGHDDHHDRHGYHHHHDTDKGLKLNGTKGDDVLTGTERNDKLFGGKGSDKLFGLAGDDKLYGGKGNDALDGGAGRDLLVGGKGDDTLLGGDGDDVLYGDTAGMGSPWTWGKCFSWNPRPDGDDFLDGGAGNDKVYAGRGDDLPLYSMAGNLGADFADIGTHDVYDGGSGFDTLVLELTHGEFLLDSVQADITAFKAFLVQKANPHSGYDKTFHFQSFDLDARNFEALEVRRVNDAPTANADAAQTDEDMPAAIGAASLLANDTDPDHLDVLAVNGADTLSALGAAISRDAGGNLTYDPTGALALQQLAEGATANDSFSYTISDLAEEAATATVQVKVTGANDAPVAANDSVSLLVTSDGGGQIEDTLLDFTGVGGSTPIISGGYELDGFFGAVTPTGAEVAAVFTGRGEGGDPDGTVMRDGGGDFAVLSVDVALFPTGAPIPNGITVDIEGYRGGSLVASLTAPIGVEFSPVDFGSAWSEIDQIRFNVVDSSFILLIDNLHVAVGEGGGGGVVVTPIDIDVLANDTDVDLGDALAVSTWDLVSAMGAAVTRNDDGALHYDPTTASIPTLAPGESVTDTFNYTVSDILGARSVATVSVVLQGADEPSVSIASLLSAPDLDLI